MDKCEFFETCFFAQNVENTELKESYCNNNPLRCARFMIYQGLDESSVPGDLMPDEKMKAYEILANN
ncbi:MAG: hypothetical protein OCD02_19215 [Spirochaetaceae bacterium]